MTRQNSPTIFDAISEKYNPYSGQRDILNKTTGGYNFEKFQHRSDLNHIFGAAEKTYMTSTNLGKFS